MEKSIGFYSILKCDSKTQQKGGKDMTGMTIRYKPSFYAWLYINHATSSLLSKGLIEYVE